MPTNKMFIEFRNRDKPAAKPIAQGQCEVALFLENKGSVVKVDLAKDGEQVGEINLVMPDSLE